MILVTGAAGFVGHHVVKALRTEDRPVRAFVRERAETSRLRAWGCEIAVGDMTDPESLRRAVEGSEVVVHLVAILQGKEEEFERVMIDGTRSLVAAAKEAGVRRFVLMSALGTTERTKDLVRTSARSGTTSRRSRSPGSSTSSSAPASSSAPTVARCSSSSGSRSARR